MIEFLKKHKRALIISVSVFTGVALALLTATIVIFSADKTVWDELSSVSYVSSLPQESEPTDNGIRLNITSPSALDSSVKQSFTVITGTSDIAAPLLLNGTEIPRNADGSFSQEVELAPGKNTFTFEHKGEITTLIIRYNYTVIKAYSPYTKQTFEAGSAFSVIALARVDCTSVTATFNGQTINLQRQPIEDESAEFVNYAGSFLLPTGNDSDINCGGVTFKAVAANGAAETYVSPSIICLRDTALDRIYVVEVVANQAETFFGNTADDWSSPTNCYLPKGTVDYRVGGTIYDSASENTYYKLRCGKRVLKDKKDPPYTDRYAVTTMYEGSLPDTNSLSVESIANGGRHTTLTLNTEWKAPFNFNLAPQGYTNPAKQDYSISAETYQYVDIKFCYATEITGDITIPEGNPIFYSAQVFSQDDGCLLRLHLNKMGGFYGWSCEYNAQGQLVFSFLNPASVSAGNNVYGTDLTGVKIMIDAGHGGRDPGALGLMPNPYNEAERNLSIAFKLKAELESMGAEVLLTRYDNSSVSADERCDKLRAAAPDLCISLHHDSAERQSADGAGVFCFNEFSNSATGFIANRTASAGIYKEVKKQWHYFYMARVSSCPVVLIENGFISSPYDFAGIVDENTNILKAQQIAQGVADYFSQRI